MGWVHRRRDLGGVIFIHLRDRDGVTQVVFHADGDPAVHAKAELLRSEYVIAVEGMVALRSAGHRQSQSATGEVEVVAEKIWILNESRTPPFPMEDNVDVKEDARLKYRYVDLRRPHMQRNIILRSKIAFAVREYLYVAGFLEIETPFMTRSTPEGARDYLVPSRVQPGTFYALPQSPQIFKQLLMVSGFDKYFQIVRCFRDEDLRADRQPEFTQIDLEMSFPQQERIFEVIEPLVQRICDVAGYDVKTPFPRLTYAQAMRTYGSDKPDLRVPPFHPVEDLFPANALSAHGLPLVAIRIPKTGALSRKERDELKAFGQERGLRVYDDAKRLERDFPEPMAEVRERTGAAEERSADAGALGRRAEGPASGRDRLPGLRAASPVRRAEVQRPAQAARPQAISSSCGWWISRCSSGTRKRTAGTRRTIRSLRCTTRISRSSPPTRRAAAPSPTTWC